MYESWKWDNIVWIINFVISFLCILPFEVHIKDKSSLPITTLLLLLVPSYAFRNIYLSICLFTYLHVCVCVRQETAPVEARREYLIPVVPTH